MDFNWVTTHMPFMALASTAKHPLRPENRPLLTRLTEQAIVGVVAAGLGIYANDIRQQGQIETLNARLTEVQQTQKDIAVVLNQKINVEVQNIKDARAVTRQETLQSLIEINRKLDRLAERAMR